MKKYLITLCKSEDEEEQVIACLSTKEVELITKSINGEYNNGYEITTIDNKKYDIGIIDEIELVTNNNSNKNEKEFLEELAELRKYQRFFKKQIALPYWDSIAEKMHEAHISLIGIVNSANSPKEVSWYVMKNIDYVVERVKHYRKEVEKELKKEGNL